MVVVVMMVTVDNGGRQNFVLSLKCNCRRSGSYSGGMTVVVWATCSSSAD
jgi:hypothetical protein